jgi:nucleoside-diphosphate-sugar epimerase
VIEREKEIIGKYPNTYTFTKALTERVLKKRHGDVKITIVRPSIVISTAVEPFLGWTETISALGGLLFAVQMGLINYLYCNSTQFLDIVPCDYVSNLVVAATALTGQSQGPCFEIYHSSSSA